MKNEEGDRTMKKTKDHDEWIPFFRTGTHTDSNGNTKTWTREDLDNTVALYHPEHHEAPLTIGHPKDSSPAYGWAAKLRRVGEVLFAKPRQVVTEFAKAVNDGLYKKRSASFYPDGSLRHIGFLGAMPPAVKGLGDFTFADDDGAVTVEVEFAEGPDEYQLRTIRRIFSRVRDFIIEKFGVETADRVVDTFDIDSLIPREEPALAGYGESPAREAGGKEEKRMKLFDWLMGKAKAEGVEIEDAPSFSEPRPAPKPQDEAAAKAAADHAEAQKKKDDELKAREEELDKKEKDFAEREAQKKKDEIKSFLDGLAKEGRVTPAMMKLGLQSFMEEVSGLEAAIEFSEGEEGKEEKKTHAPIDVVKKILSGLPKQIEFGEVAGAGKGGPAGADAGEKLEAIARKKMKEKDGLAYREALDEAMQEHPELAQEYAESIGPAH